MNVQKKPMSEEKLRLRDNLQTTPRKIGLINQIRFLAKGQGSIAWIIFFSWLLILVYTPIWGAVVDAARQEFGFRNLTTTQGKITLSDQTWDLFDESCYVMGFEFTIDGSRHEGFCYSRGWANNAGAPAVIEYNPKKPSISRIERTSYSLYRWSVLIPLIPLFLTGLSGIAGWFANMKWGRLLARGEITEARLKNRDRGEGFQSAPFSFQDQTGAPHELELTLPPDDKLVDEEVELGLYDPKKVKRFYLIDQLPFKMDMTRPGVWDPPKAGDMISILIRLGILGGLIFWTFTRIAQLG